MKILLIYPRNPLFKWNTPFKCEPLSLPILASLTPLEHDIRIIDEQKKEINYEEDVDLIGISFMTHQAPRAYEIADKSREKGIKVVLGGIHTSALPEEALNHADAICIGEAENIWIELLKDFKDNNLKKIYRGGFSSLQGLPFPRLDLLEIGNPFTSIYSSRGCPFHCEFCAVSKFYGKRYRTRPVEEVIEEIRFRKIEKAEATGWLGEPKLLLSWLDDNICGNKAYFKYLFEKISKENVKWGALTTLNIAKDDELLRLIQITLS